MKSMGLLRKMRNSYTAGGGMIAYTLSASNTTLLSFHIAHLADHKTLTIFAFLLSVLYFSIILCRRNIVEPYLSTKYNLNTIQKRKSLYIIFTLLFTIYFTCMLVTDVYTLPFFMFLANVTSISWEVRKAILRKMGKIFTYTVFEAISFAIFSSIVFLDLINKKLAIELSIIILFVLQSFFLYRTREFAKSIIKSSNSSVEKQKMTIHSYGEYIFVGTILVSNLYFMSRGFWEPLGELRALFLLLILSTFIVGALRNSLITEKIGSKVNRIMLLILLINLILIFALPQKYLVQIIPTLPVDLKIILIPVAIDILGSLIFSICYMHSIKKGNLFGSGASRLISSFMTIILINVYFVPRNNLETSAFAWLYAISSISGATFMLFYIYRKKMNFARRFGRSE